MQFLLLLLLLNTYFILIYSHFLSLLLVNPIFTFTIGVIEFFYLLTYFPEDF